MKSGDIPTESRGDKKGKLALAEVYKQPDPLPEIANESIVNEEADPELLNEDAAPRPSTLTRSATPVVSILKPRNDHSCLQKKI